MLSLVSMEATQLTKVVSRRSASAASSGDRSGEQSERGGEDSGRQSWRGGMDAGFSKGAGGAPTVYQPQDHRKLGRGLGRSKVWEKAASDWRACKAKRKRKSSVSISNSGAAALEPDLPEPEADLPMLPAPPETDGNASGPPEDDLAMLGAGYELHGEVHKGRCKGNHAIYDGHIPSLSRCRQMCDEHTNCAFFAVFRGKPGWCRLMSACEEAELPDVEVPSTVYRKKAGPAGREPDESDAVSALQSRVAVAPKAAVHARLRAAGAEAEGGAVQQQEREKLRVPPELEQREPMV